MVKLFFGFLGEGKRQIWIHIGVVDGDELISVVSGVFVVESKGVSQLMGNDESMIGTT